MDTTNAPTGTIADGTLGTETATGRRCIYQSWWGGWYRLTSCCAASAKGMEDGIGCRGCYRILSDDEVMESEGGPVAIADVTPDVAR